MRILAEMRIGEIFSLILKHEPRKSITGSRHLRDEETPFGGIPREVPVEVRERVW